MAPTLLNNRLAELLGSVQTPGDFFVSGTSALHVPLLQVRGVGTIAMPLLPAQAAQLIAVAERAPYGRGGETLIDTDVRRTWQIGAERIRLGGKHWGDTLQAIVEAAAAGLGAGTGVTAELYKLLVYDEGSFFVSHRDTEKAPGMFATLIVALPSLHAGGELLVQHRDREVRLDLRSDDPSEVAYAAFYADCVHEVLPVTAGCRLALVYNLLRPGRSGKPQPPDYDSETAGLSTLLCGWCEARSLEELPKKLVYPLDHAYTPAELSFPALKGADAAAANVLQAAARQAGCDVHVALMKIEESGSAEHTGYSGSRRYRRHHDDEDDGDEFAIGEVFERNLTLSHWGRPDNTDVVPGTMPFIDEEVCPADALQDIEPDDQHFEEATGNEGASFERSYQRAALVLWPVQRRLQVLAGAGLQASLPYLAALVRQWEETGADRGDALRQQAYELVGHLQALWPADTGPYGGNGSDARRSPAAHVLASLVQLAEPPRIDAFVAGVCAARAYGKSDNTGLITALQRLPAPRAGELLRCVIEAHADLQLGACSDLLSRAAIVTPWSGELNGAAQALVDALPGDPARPVAAEHAWRREHADAAVVGDLLRALCRIDTALADRAVSHWLAWPKTYGLDTVMVPALRRLAEQPSWFEHDAGRRLRAAALQHLQARVALPLGPPADWQREVNVACRCEHCQALRAFLLNANESTWRFKAREADREHVTDSIRQGHNDLDCSTERKGSPHVLVCTKNQAGYERRVKQRRVDLEDLARLG